VIGIRYTTARGDAGRALDLLLQQMPNAPDPAPTDRTPLIGGDIGDFAGLRSRARREVPASIQTPTLDAWLRNHGSEYQSLAAMASAPDEARPLGKNHSVMAEVTHSVAQEMAVRLDDVILRRTDLGSGSHPGTEAITLAADRMQQLLNWSAARRGEEIARTEATLNHHLAAVMKSAALF
jgi:glycerol-3-phosphate dehydrogenase